MTNYSAFRGRSRRPGLIDDNAVEAFNPNKISGCVGWYDAANINQDDGSLVSLWVDSSSSSRNATGSGASRPTFKTNILNGRPVVRFAGAHFLDMGSFNLAVGAYFVVFSKLSTTNNDAILLQSGAGYTYLQYSTSWYVIAGTYTVNKMQSGKFYLRCAIYNGTNINTYSNGNNTDTITSSTGLLNRYIGGSGFNFYGDMAELILYNAVPSDTNRVRIENYLNQKYDLW